MVQLGSSHLHSQKAFLYVTYMETVRMIRKVSQNRDVGIDNVIFVQSSFCMPCTSWLRHIDKVESGSHPKDPLRGCPLPSLLYDRSLLRNSEGNSAAQAISAPVDTLDIFLSHVWSDSGLWKQTALLLCCIPPIAYKIALLASILVICFVWDPALYQGSIWYKTAILSLHIVIFAVCTISSSLYKHRNTMVFLDKCCINQTDLTEKARGISRLSDYLQNSDKLIILWTPNYLDRLWCVYELAVFMRTHDTKNVIVVNLGHVKLCVSLTIVQLLGTVFQWPIAASSAILRSHIHVFCNICEVTITCILVGREVLRCSEEWTTFASKLKSFDVNKAKCTSGDDHKKLRQLICNMYGSEANFSALVKRLWLGRKRHKGSPIWCLSPTSWIIMSAPFVPAIAEGVISVFLMVFVSHRMSPLTRVLPPGTAWEAPSTLTTLAWAIRTRLLPVLLRSFLVPLVISVARELARQKSRLHIRSLIGFQYTLVSLTYTWFSRASCGLGIFHTPISEATVQESCYEVFSLLVGLAALWTVWSIFKYSYSLPMRNATSL